MESMSLSDWQQLFRASWQDLWLWLKEASRVREARFGRRVSLCVIINAKSGLCSEDCAFCSQAATSRAEIAKYPLLPWEKLLEAARAAQAQGAARFSIVTSGKGITSAREKSDILRAVAAIRERVPVRVCASLGVADRGFLQELKDAGLYRFHHNLETAASFYPQICSTHRYEERLATVAAAQEAGLEVCVGGIFGLGETLAQRYEMAQTLKTLEVDAIPLNFLHPLPGTRLADRPLLKPLEALKIIIAFRLSLPDKTIIICGGRQPTLRSLAPLIFAAGANALMTGDYLTTKGRLPEEDRQMLEDLGLELEVSD
ncbi:MAG: biotin synthase BioB [Deltaproteobacteria bacterium]|nr:biotin synthase BioB [Deltaproteobacteria bacterium]